MMYSTFGSRCAQVSCSAVIATALTVGVATPQPGHSFAPAESHLVDLRVALTSMTVNAASAIPTEKGQGSSASVTPTAAATAAAAGGLTDVVTGAAFFAGGLVGLALSPIYYLLLPITYPLAVQLYVSVETARHGFYGLDIETGSVGALVFPVLMAFVFQDAVSVLLGGMATASTAAARPSASARANATSAVSATAAPSPRRNQAQRASVSRQVGAKPAATTLRSARLAAVAQSSDASKVTGAGSERRSTR